MHVLADNTDLNQLCSGSNHRRLFGSERRDVDGFQKNVLASWSVLVLLSHSIKFSVQRRHNA